MVDDGRRYEGGRGGGEFHNKLELLQVQMRALGVIEVAFVRDGAPAEGPVELVGMLEGDRLGPEVEADRGEYGVGEVVLQPWYVVKKSFKIGGVVLSEFRRESLERAFYEMRGRNEGWLLLTGLKTGNAANERVPDELLK